VRAGRPDICGATASGREYIAAIGAGIAVTALGVAAAFERGLLTPGQR
jgi:hypothetical protein